MDNQHGFNQQKNIYHNQPDIRQSITPVFIVDIKRAVANLEGEVLKIDDRPVGKMYIVGEIVNYNQENNITYVDVDDGTGILKILCLKKYD